MFNSDIAKLLLSVGFAVATFATGATGQALDGDRQEQALFSGQLPVAAGKRRSFSFTTHSHLCQARIAGSLQAIGGAGNDIRVLIAKDRSLIFDSGQRRSVVFSVEADEPGQYTIIFDNGFSLVSPKLVSGRINLVSSGIDAEQDVEDRQKAAAYVEQASQILQRLYGALETDEQKWGTKQLSGTPLIRWSNDESINAAATVATNSIQVSRGLFKFSESAAPEGSVLAAALSHELSHLYYRHPGYGSGQGGSGFLDELLGKTALDRVQEKEADLLGIQIACQAGFDPQGELTLLNKFVEIIPTASHFMKNHPSAVERLQYLQAEVSRCQAERAGQHETLETQVNTQRETLTSDELTAYTDRSSWTLVQNPNLPWRFKITDSFVYGELLLPENLKSFGNFDTVDLTKQGDRFVGKQRIHRIFKIRNTSLQGFQYKTCEWDFDVELISITEDRLEGRWTGHPRNSIMNPLDCTRSGEVTWADVTWVRKEK